MAHDPSRRYPDGTAVAQALVDAWHKSLRSGAIPVSAFAISSSPTPPRPTPPKPAKAHKPADETLIDVGLPASLAAEEQSQATSPPPAATVVEERSAAREPVQVAVSPPARPRPAPVSSASSPTSMRWLLLVVAALAVLAALWLLLRR